mmetsp:Transcript_26227/g.61969  ORF Transcript_26227/g.61969 Transcript_26227/m.61969 type:complete len:255 (-) Transcript_26227:6445-7209(-)
MRSAQVLTQITSRHGLHCVDHNARLAAELAQHAAGNRQPQHADHEQHHHANGHLLHRRTPHELVDIVHVQARADHPAPAGHLHQELQLRHRLLAAGAREVGVDEGLPIGRGFQRGRHVLDRLAALAVDDLVAHGLAGPLRLDRVDHAHGLERPGVEVLGAPVLATIARAAHRVLGGGLRRLHGQLAAGGLLLQGDHLIGHGLHGSFQQLAPARQRVLVGLDHVDDHLRGDPHHGGGQQQQDAALEAHLVQHAVS